LTSTNTTSTRCYKKKVSAYVFQVCVVFQINFGANIKLVTMQEQKVFASGFSFKRNDKAPEFVIGRQSIKVDEAIAFLQQRQKNGWVNIDIKQAKGGNYYCELDTWEAKPQGADASSTEQNYQAAANKAAEPKMPF
jgi:thiol:disulfide interchange protein